MPAGKGKTHRKTVEIRIGGNMLEGIDNLKTRKGIEETADHTVYLKSFGQLCSILSERKLDLSGVGIKFINKLGKLLLSLFLRVHRVK